MSYMICPKCGGANGVVNTTVFQCGCNQKILVSTHYEFKAEPEIPKVVPLPLTAKVWYRFLKCMFFHKGSTVNGCSICNLEFWK